MTASVIIVDVYKSILDWSNSRPAWERDALRRVAHRVFEPTAIAELAGMAKAESGISCDAKAAPVPFAPEHGTRALGTAEPVVLEAMHGIRNVNALADGQKLTFASAGLTVIYGENGTGKTCYARVFRRACRARKAPDIVGNVAVSAPAAPEAIFTVRKGSEPSRDVHWTQAKASPEELGAFCVFDRDCEHCFVDEEGETAFVPDGLGLFHELVTVVAQVRDKLAEEERLPPPSKGSLDDIRKDISAPQGAVEFLEQVVTGKNAKAYEDMLASLATFCASTEDAGKFEQLDAQLAELKVNDPVKKASGLRRLATKVENALVAWKQAVDTLSNEKIAKLRAAIERDRQAKRTLAVVGNDYTRLRSSGPLPLRDEPDRRPGLRSESGRRTVRPVRLEAAPTERRVRSR